MERAVAVDRVLDLLDTIETEPMPVPIREVWVFGDLALRLDPVSRIDVYLTKDLLFAGGDSDPAAEAGNRERFGVSGIGTTVRASWAADFPEFIRANDNGHAAPERCLAAHLVRDDEPIHLEVCNAGFEQNVTQRLRGAIDREAYSEILDPRGVCLWVDGTRSETAPATLRAGDYVFPTLEEALEMLGMDRSDAARAAEAVAQWRRDREGSTVRGEVV